MMLLAFDTETSGFVRSKIPATHPDQARLVELGAILAYVEGLEDEAPTVHQVAVLQLLVEQELEIPEAATEVHGITAAQTRAHGVPLAVAVRAFRALLGKAEVLVGHNLQFDISVLDLAIEVAYPGRSFVWPARGLDTMAGLRQVFRKAPKLEEAYRHAFNRPMQCAHSAMADCEATLELLAWACQNGHMTTATKEAPHG